ncbi:unnamed protein product [Spirodela intermedia]|uniref:Uncharacterized protein n=1 Tax=Spirodela intermedia TaxID=51605 RepID=A0A7I8KJ22_SPIIN|nr:unnamed protein product [Spirodela intermedia]
MGLSASLPKFAAPSSLATPLSSFDLRGTYGCPPRSPRRVAPDGFPVAGRRGHRYALVSKRWLAAEGCIRHDSTLLTPPQLLLVAFALSQRFDAMNSIGDEAVALISARCPNLVRLKLGACRQISYRGMVTLAKNCSRFRQLSCVDCNFGTKGISAMLAHCPLLEEISVMLLEDCTDDIVVSPWSAPSLKVISLIWFHVECIFPLVIECLGNWDSLLEELPQRVRGLVRLHLVNTPVTDRRLSGVSSWPSLEVLHLAGGLGLITSSCRKLEHLAVVRMETIGDGEIPCISPEGLALKELHITRCCISNHGPEALVICCPSLMRAWTA